MWEKLSEEQTDEIWRRRSLGEVAAEIGQGSGAGHPRSKAFWRFMAAFGLASGVVPPST
jgi:hypothetical protein